MTNRAFDRAKQKAKVRGLVITTKGERILAEIAAGTYKFAKRGSNKRNQYTGRFSNGQ